MKRFAVYTLLILPTAAFLRADWLNFRGPSGSGYDSSAENPPTELSEASIAWKTPLPGRGLGSPIIVGDRVLVTAASGPEQKQLHVLCFSTIDGSPLWERSFWATGRTMTQGKTCVAAPTPASDGKRIYALYSSNDLICLNLDGDVVWMRGLTLDYPNASNSLGMASSPIVADDTLVAQIENDSESFAAGFDLLTGINKWKIERPAAANWTSPTLLKIDSRTVVALQSSKGVLGVLPDTGSPVFHFDDGASTIPSSAASGDMLFIPSNGMTAVKVAANGAEPGKIWNESAQRPGVASPILIDGKVYTINSAGVLSCAEAATGKRLWRIRLKGPFSSSPVAGGNGHLYVFSETGVGQCVDLRGKEGKVVSEIELNETILGTPALTRDSVYVRSDETLWRMSAK